MYEATVKTVTGKAYDKRRKKFSAGVTVKKKSIPREIKAGILYLLISIFFYMAVGLACAAAANMKSLWYETLILPPYIVSHTVFMAVYSGVSLLLGYVFYRSLLKKDKAQIINLSINGLMCILLAYMFYILKSPLGSLVIIIVLIIQTITVAAWHIKSEKLSALFLLVFILFQAYLLASVYAILMLN